MDSHVIFGATTLLLVSLAGGGGCKTEDPIKSTSSPSSSPSATAVVSSPQPTPTPTPTPSASTPTTANTVTGASAKVFHYDLAIAGPTETIKVSLAASDAATGSVSFGKNVVLGSGARSDVGSTVKGKVTMQGDTPVLDLDATVSSVDPATNQVQKATLKGSAPTPIGTSTVVVSSTQDGKAYKITATPSPLIAVVGQPEPPGATFAVDVAVNYLPGNAPAKKTALSFNVTGETPAVAKHRENVPLSTGDGGVAVARQDTGTRVKAVAHPHTSGLELDFDLELSGIESAPLGFTIRKITSRGPILAPLDKATTVLSADDNGNRYEVTVTPRRAK